MHLNDLLLRINENVREIVIYSMILYICIIFYIYCFSKVCRSLKLLEKTHLKSYISYKKFETGFSKLQNEDFGDVSHLL